MRAVVLSVLKFGVLVVIVCVLCDDSSAESRY